MLTYHSMRVSLYETVAHKTEMASNYWSLTPSPSNEVNILCVTHLCVFIGYFLSELTQAICCYNLLAVSVLNMTNLYSFVVPYSDAFFSTNILIIFIVASFVETVMFS